MCPAVEINLAATYLTDTFNTMSVHLIKMQYMNDSSFLNMTDADTGGSVRLQLPHYKHVQVVVNSRRITCFHVPNPKWNITLMCMWAPSLLTNLNHVHTSIRAEMSPGSFSVGILQVLNVTLIFFFLISGCRRCFDLRQSRNHKPRFSFPSSTYLDIQLWWVGWPFPSPQHSTDTSPPYHFHPHCSFHGD